MNKDLYNNPKGEIEFPKDKQEHMKKCFHMVKGANENIEGFKRNQELTVTHKVKQQFLCHSPP